MLSIIFLSSFLPPPHIQKNEGLLLLSFLLPAGPTQPTRAGKKNNNKPTHLPVLKESSAPVSTKVEVTNQTSGPGASGRAG